ncbi:MULTISPECIES: phosphoserine phosphatase SerB [Methylobacterium]|uniref:Phosphoserine phosphatase n=1 Tax=Methylobacterium thuringiense TaxID=1003091 RepID=A0ABQ4TQ82_9HYPH|nr:MULTISPECIES: phosphoserine phosphatase SerB [Methylobacterium]TXN20154.1 phosphoserine phosphatase SerB [Methylobacterium sp. WL9]GJE57524.1 Phosphoserine phosphatase SerB2 [Methylobacterium thuringiense]
MTLVATLIANPDRPAITGAVLTDARAILGTEHPPRLLHHGVAAECLVDAPIGQAPDLTARLRDAFAGEPIDVAVLPAGPHRRKRLFLADMDSTMIEQECIDELAGVLGIKSEVAAITERAMRGEVAFEPALRQRVALLKGLPASVADDLIATRITLMPGGRTLLATMKAHGARTCLVSGGFSVFTGPIAKTLGFDETRANRLDLVDGQLSGTVAEPIVGAEAKRATLLELRARLGLAIEDTMAVGDGANDLAMLAEAGLGVAFRAKPAVAAAAHVRIEYGDLTALLYLQGFSAAEFVG